MAILDLALKALYGLTANWFGHFFAAMTAGETEYVYLTSLFDLMIVSSSNIVSDGLIWFFLDLSWGV